MMKLVQPLHDTTDAPEKFKESIKRYSEGRYRGHGLSLSRIICGCVKMNATEIWLRGDNVDMKFGMTIRTKEVHNEDGGILHIHKVHKVSRTGVAFAMHIRDGDEILLIGEDHFAPDLTQAEVIKLLRDVKVDGLSRFSLVLQRCNGKRLSKRRGKKCCLIETSAILASRDLHSDDSHPIAEDVRFYERQNDVTSRSYHRYKISGTQLFLEINDNALVVNVVTGTDADNNKILCKYTKISQAKDGEVMFLAALADEQAKNYICIKNKKIHLQSKLTWFDMRMKSSDIQFQKKNLFLAYDETDNKVHAAPTTFWFEEIPGDKGFFVQENSANLSSSPRTEEKVLEQTEQAEEITTEDIPYIDDDDAEFTNDTDDVQIHAECPKNKEIQEVDKNSSNSFRKETNRNGSPKCRIASVNSVRSSSDVLSTSSSFSSLSSSSTDTDTTDTSGYKSD